STPNSPCCPAQRGLLRLLDAGGKTVYNTTQEKEAIRDAVCMVPAVFDLPESQTVAGRPRDRIRSASYQNAKPQRGRTARLAGTQRPAAQTFFQHKRPAL